MGRFPSRQIAINTARLELTLIAIDCSPSRKTRVWHDAASVVTGWPGSASTSTVCHNPGVAVGRVDLGTRLSAGRTISEDGEDWWGRSAGNARSC
jgi:hypothetical protein